ncbi:MAG: hypothetical protein PHZ09_05285 [Eubacteriales bacterium]|nr:hypothetical protein [Eubacteriales bacterium]
MKDRIFIAVVCSILLIFFLASPVIAALSVWGPLDALNTKNLFVTEKIYGGDTPASALLNTVEETKTFLRNVYINCIPFYDSLVSSVQSAEMSMLRVTDNVVRPILTRDSVSVLQNDSGADDTSDKTDKTGGGSETQKEEPPPVDYYSIFLGGNGRPNFYAIEPLKVLERVEGARDKELEKLAERQLRHIHRLREATPGINYYIYMGTRLQESAIFNDLITGADSTLPYLEFFIDCLDSDIKFDYMRMDTPEDRVNKSFRTDHHWNIFGAYEGYQQIINMMYEDSPEIGRPVEYEIIQVPDIKWFGSLGSTIGHNDMGYADNFHILDTSSLPRYGGNNYRINDMLASFMNGEFNKFGVGFDYYAAYNPPQDKYVFPDNDTGRNLLLLGDSYSWSITTIIASHFDRTYCHNRPWTIPADVTYDYRELIAENEITDVLILLYSSRLLFGYDGTDFARMLTD